jgi:hypothetical protein
MEILDEASPTINYTLVEETLKLLEEGMRRIIYHPKKEYVLIVGKAGTGEFSTFLNFIIYINKKYYF